MSWISKKADDAEKVRKELERALMAREDQIEQLENKHKEAKYLAADAERKYEEVARKLNMMEKDQEKALGKADNSENRIIDLEMELKVVGDNMKCMEVKYNKNGKNGIQKNSQVREEKAHQREDTLKDQIRHLMLRLKVCICNKIPKEKFKATDSFLKKERHLHLISLKIKVPCKNFISPQFQENFQLHV